MHTQSKDNIPAQNLAKGSLIAIAAFFFMALFGVLTKMATTTADPISVSLIAYSVAAVGTAVCILPRGIKALQSMHYGYLMARAVIGTIASFLYMISMRYIPVVNSTLLFNTAPIFIPLLSVIVLKHYEKKNIWYAVILGFIGIIAIIKPGIDLFTDPGNLIGLLSGFVLAVAYLIMKKLTSTETGLRIILYYFCIGTLMQLPLLKFVHIVPSQPAVIYAMSSGLMLMFAQLCLVKAYCYATASQVGIYQYCSVVFVAIIEWLFWAKIPDLLDFIGFGLVAIAGIYIIYSSSKR